MDVPVRNRQHSFAGAENRGIAIEHQYSFVSWRNTVKVPDDVYRRSASRAGQRHRRS
jgi:hypothetical protein